MVEVAVDGHKLAEDQIAERAEEDLGDQEAGVAAFREAGAELPPVWADFYAEAADFAERHRVVIERFGRFPKRNEALGRKSTAEEEAYLAEHPAGF